MRILFFFVTTCAAFVTLALCNRDIFEEEIRSQLDMLGLAWKPMLPTSVAWSDFEVLSTQVDNSGQTGAPAKTCHLPLGVAQSNAPKTKRPGRAKFSLLSQQKCPKVNMGTYSEKPKIDNDAGRDVGRTVTLREDGSWSYCAMAGDAGAFLDVRSTANTEPSFQPWEIQNGFLILPPAPLQVKTVSSIDNGGVFGHGLPVDPPEQAIIISLLELEEFSFSKLPADQSVPVLDCLKKWIGLGMDKLMCDVTPGMYELQEQDHHITLTLYDGVRFIYQETRQLPDGSSEEIASDHRFGRWRVDSSTQMLHLNAPGRYGFKHRRFVRGRPVWERRLESVALPIAKLTAAHDGGMNSAALRKQIGATMSYQPIISQGLFPDHESLIRTPNADQDVDLEQEKISFEEFKEVLVRLGYPDAKDEAPELFHFLDANAGCETGFVAREDMHSLEEYGSTADPEWVGHLHKWLMDRPGGVEGFFDAAMSQSAAESGSRRASRSGTEEESRSGSKRVGSPGPDNESEYSSPRKGSKDFMSNHSSPSNGPKKSVVGLSKESFFAALEDTEYPHMSRGEAVFKSIDVNRTGVLTDENLKVLHLFAAMNMMKNVKTFKEYLERTFDTVKAAMKALDKDKSKKISLDEWDQACQELNISSEMGSRIFGFVDMDGSQQITSDELQKFLTDLDPQEFVAELQKFRDTCISTYGSLEKTFEAMMEGEKPAIRESGVLTCDNFNKACKRLDLKFPMDTCWIFTFLDVTRSHTVSLGEFTFLTAFTPGLLNGAPKRFHQFLEGLFRSTEDAFEYFMDIANKRRTQDKLSRICKERLKEVDSTYTSGLTQKVKPSPRQRMDVTVPSAKKKAESGSVWSRSHQLSLASKGVFPGIRCRSPLTARLDDWGPTTVMERPALVVPPRPHSVASSRYSPRPHSVASTRY